VVAADPDKPGELVNVIRELASDVNRLRTMGEAAKAAAPAYDRFKELQKFVQLFNDFSFNERDRKAKST